MRKKWSEKRLAEQLDAYIDLPSDTEGGERQPPGAPIVDALRLGVANIEPTPEFVARLSVRLHQHHTARSSAPRRFISPRLVWAGAAIVVALVLGLVLPALFDSHQNLPPLPRLVYASGPGSRSVLAGLLTGTDLVLATDLPDAPTEMPIYRATTAPLPTTSEEALAWAHDFGLSNPQVYRDPREPEALYVLGSDDQRLIFRPFGPMGEVHYGNGAAADVKGAPLSFDQATEVALAFLREHDLLSTAYRVEEPTDFAPSVERPIRMVHIVPELDGRPLVGYSTGLHVAVNPAGQVTYANLNTVNVECDGLYPIKSAQEAYEELVSGQVAGSLFRLDTDIRPSSDLAIRHYYPDAPAYSIGDLVTVTGTINVLEAVDGSDVHAELVAHSPDAYDLTGPLVAELSQEAADRIQTDGTVQMQVRGIIQAQQGPRQWELEVLNWEIAPPRQPQCPVGTLMLDDEDVWLTTDEGEHYRLPNAPEEMTDGERIEACADSLPAGGGDLDWWLIVSPPASEAMSYVGSSSVSAVVVVEEPVEEPLPATRAESPFEMGQSIEVTGIVHASIHANDKVYRVHALLVVSEQGEELPPYPLYGSPELLEEIAQYNRLQVRVSGRIVPNSTQYWGMGLNEQAIDAESFRPLEEWTSQEVEVTGVLRATIYVKGDVRRVEASLYVEEQRYALCGPREVLEAVAQLDRLHVRVRGQLTASPQEGWAPGGLGIEVESFEKVWSDERVQGFLGHLDLERLEGREVAVFTDHETDQRYVLAPSLEIEGYWTAGQDPILDYEQIFMAGVVHPEDSYAGLPILTPVSSQFGRETEAATSADQFPVEVGPQVVNEDTMMESGKLQGALVVDRVELAYYYEPQMPSSVVSPDEGPTWNQPVEQILQPVWVFRGHNADNTISFVAYVQAVTEEYVESTVPVTPAPPTEVPTLVPASTSTPVTPAPVYATQQAAQQATIVARATTSPFPTAGPATVQTGQPSIATTQRDGLSFQLRLPKDTYLAGEGGQAEAVLRNDGPETVFVYGSGQHLVQPVLLDEQGHEPVPWPWSPMVLPMPPYLQKLAPGQAITETLNFQVPPEEQAAGHTYVLWAETRFSRPAPDSPEGPDNLWLHLETGPIPLQVTPPNPAQQLMAQLQADRDGWHLQVTDPTGQAPAGQMWGMMEAASSHAAAARRLEDSADGTWASAWDSHMRDGEEIIVRAWVASPGYVTAAITQTLPGEGDTPRMFGAEPPTHQTFDSLETAQAALDFSLYQPGNLPAGAVLDNVQVETRSSEGRRWTDVSQMYRLPDDTWLELVQMVTTDHYASAGWGQARYEPEACPVAVGQHTGYVIRRFDWWVLDWKVGDVGFELRAPVPALSLDDLLSIATGSPAAISLPGRLIYESGGDIWIVERGQPPRVLLTDGSNPQLSPDGNSLLFLRANPELSLSDLWLADFTCPAASAPCQMNQRRLIGPAEFGSPLIYDLAWSPDGRTVALTTGSNAKTIYSEDLWLVDVETGDYRQVLDDDGGVPCYSPDGAWIALSMPYTGYQHGQLSLIAADGSSYRPLFDRLFSCEGKWLPDGLLVAGIVRLSQTTEAEVTAELWQVPVVGEPVRLATIPAAHSFRWSADGRRLAYLADDPAGWLHIAQGDGSEPVAVPGTDERTWPHSWSPGRQFLAVIHDGQYFFVPDDPAPALIPMPAPFWLWLDDDSYLTAEWITDDPQADRGHFEVSRAWLDGRCEFLFEAESLNGLAYRP